MSKYQYRRFSKDIKYLYLRNEKFHYRRVIPKDLREFYDGQHWIRALKTDDTEVALSRRTAIHKACEQEFSLARLGIPPKLQTPLDSEFIQENRLGDLTTEDLGKPENEAEFNRRVILAVNSKNPSQELGPIFGTAAKPLLLSQTVDRWHKIMEYDFVNFSERQRKKKLNEKHNAFNKLIDSIGDRSVKDLTKTDSLAFVESLKKEVVSGSIQADTANKYLSHIKAAFNKIIESGDVLKTNPFTTKPLKAEKKKRPSFSTKWITEKIFAQNIIDSLDCQDLCLLMLMTELGAGYTELCFLDPAQDIDLTASTPHIHIKPNQYRPKLKTSSRERTLPLSKFAVERLKLIPDLFQKYRSQETGNTLASYKITSIFKSKNLLETPYHKPASLRHSFMDRVRNENITFDIQSYLLGHSQSLNARVC